MSEEKTKEEYLFLVIEGMFRVLGSPVKNHDGSITGVLYRNIEDYNNNKHLEPSYTFMP